ncbi:hypothetical protein KP509_27G060700 [Ceratopteris richardii]|uniref:Trehalose 6-phosphate phosphatase n=2 Tax=Ceratopteris richardii TaxID=49495 RepID=A0A8T2RH04_CERRI|nr:hypothetical protein KP509_27G060700 [Ceratopteris richardii]
MAFGPVENGVIAETLIATPKHTLPPNPGFAYSKIWLIPPRTELAIPNVWVDSMRACSPPHSCYVKGDPFDIDIHYRAWIAKHPSALNIFDQIVEVAKGKQIVMFLDYDGTLSPIVKDPERAIMSEAMRTAVRKLAACFPTAIISGRNREKVFDFVGLSELYYAGSHGMDIMGPAQGSNGIKASGVKSYDGKGNEVVLFQPAKDFESTINKDWDVLADEVRAVVQFFPTLCLTEGRKVLEVRPSISWDKGKALEYLLNALGLEGRPDVFPVYIGDDRTDEDAFKVLNKQNHGLGILVSTAVKETNAQSSLRDPSEVLEFLQRLVCWQQNHT